MDTSDVEVIARETVYAGHARVERWRLRHRLYRGGWGQELVREVVDRGHAAAVLPYDPAREEVMLIEQFRAGALGAGAAPWTVEVVAGLVDPGEKAEDVARREAVEEAGIELGEMLAVCSALTSPGILTESVAVFCARADTARAGGTFGLDHEGEDIRAFTVGFEAAMGMVARGEINNIIAVVALQWLALNREMLRARWR